MSHSGPAESLLSGAKPREKDGKPMADKTPANVKKIRDTALSMLAELGGRTTGEDDIVFNGTKFVVPETMKDLNQAIKFLAERVADEEQTYEFSRTYRYRPYDGAMATARALKKAFGMSIGKTVTVQGMFGPQTIKPSLIDVEVGVDEYEQAPWGYLGIPGLDKVEINLDMGIDPEYGRVFRLNGEGPRKYRFHIEGLMNLVQRELETESIYRGKAIDGQATPRFLNISSVDPETVVYADETLTQFEASVWSPIENADQLADLGEPGKRAVLFEGPYGTGKTLAAYLTAQRAVASGWTFLMARPGRDNLEEVIQTARMYQPAVVFTEDIDTIAAPDSGNQDHMSKVLDLFDGLDTKGLRMLLVLTTNNVETLHPAMLRPGRLDAIIPVGALDQSGIERLAKVTLGTKLREDIDWELVYKANEDYTPAYVREGFGRVVRFQVARNGSLNEVTTDDLVNAAESLRPQQELMAAAAERGKAKPDPLREGLGSLVAQKVEDVVDRTVFVDPDGDPTRVGPGKGLAVQADAPERKSRRLQRRT